MLKFIARSFLSVLVALSLLVAAARPSFAVQRSMSDSEMPTISSTMDCPACVPVAHGAGSLVCMELPCFNLTKAAEINSPIIFVSAPFALQIEQLPEGLASKPPTPPV
jgi:hypothetical protein